MTRISRGLSTEQMNASLPALTEEEYTLLLYPNGPEETARAEEIVARRAKGIRDLRERTNDL